jgi:hypothetical protein
MSVAAWENSVLFVFLSEYYLETLYYYLHYVRSMYSVFACVYTPYVQY